MTEKQYEVTIGIPVYNIERYVRLAMDSALNQTFESIEFLVVDDCGTDSSMDIVRQYQQSHPRGGDIRIVRQPQNGGLGRARNRIIDEARGRFLYHLDGDDEIALNTIELLHHQMISQGADIVYGSFERVYVEDGSVVKSVPSVYQRTVFTKPDSFACFAYERKLQTMKWNFLIRTDILRQNHLRVAPVGFGEDFTFTVDLPTYVTRAVLLPDVTYRYFIRDVNTRRWNRHVTRELMDAYIQTIDQKKRRTELRSKPYYARRCETLMMYDFSFANQILQRRDTLTPRYTDREIRDIMWHPMALCEILRSPEKRAKNLAAYAISIMPPWMAVAAMKALFKVMYKEEQ